MTGRLIKRLTAAAASLMLLCGTARADIAWPAATTAGQDQLQQYVAQVNDNLMQLGRSTINSVFECYTGSAALGVTAQDGAELPEGIELYFNLYPDTINLLTLRVSRVEQFAAMAAACIQAVSPEGMTLTETMKAPSEYMNRAMSSPTTSFEDEVTTLNGTSPRTYYAYFPDQYRDGVSWLQLTLVFPLAGYSGESVRTTPTPTLDGDTSSTEEYTGENYKPSDDLTHFEVFVTATPEPDSPAGEQ